MALPAEILPRIRQFVRLMASDKDGEVLSAVRALGRTLKNEGCDFHDVADAIAPISWPPPPRYDTRPAPEPKPAQPAKAAPEWPTFARLKHSQRVAWLNEIEKRSSDFKTKTKVEFDALNRKIIVRPHEILSRKEINLFNRLVRIMWAMEVRI
jgi:hypothetical protein